MDLRIISTAFFLSVVSTALALNELLISPNQPVLSKPVGGNVLLTCQANVEKEDLMTDLAWWDPRGLIVDGNHPFRQRLSTEKLTKGSSALSLIIQSFQQTDAGAYTCTGTYANTERLNKTVRLDSIYPIKWEDAPEEQNPVVGRDYKVRCKVSANPSPYVDWMRNGEPIRPTDRYVIQTDGLLIPNVNDGDDGVYTCRAIVVMTGELAQRNIHVEVHTPPQFGEMSKVIELVEGTTASFVCNATGKPNPSFQWIKDKEREDLSKKSRFGVNSVTGMLTINPVAEQDDGEYRCVASNPAAKVERIIKMQVQVPPKIPLLVNLTANLNSEAVLACRAKGKPLPTISFKKFGTDNELVEGNYPYDPRILVERIEDPETGEVVGKLRIRNIQQKDDGLYHCIAKNKAGVLYKTGHITVQFPPTFQNSPAESSKVWSWEQRPVNLTCLAESIPNATIIWKFRNTEIQFDSYVNLIQPGPYSILRVQPVNINYYGFYSCIAENILGKAERRIELKMATPPGIIPQVNPERVSATSIKFVIREPQDTGTLNITSYVVQYTNDLNNPWANPGKYTWPVGSQYYVENLTPDTQYHFRFAAVNPVGQGPWVSGGEFRTQPRMRPSPPEILVSEQIGGVVMSPEATRMEIRWKISSETGGVPILSHRIRYCVVSNPRDMSAYKDCTNVELPVEQYRGLSFVLQNLYPDTLYRIELTASNKMGVSDPNIALFRTSKGIGKDLLVSANGGHFPLTSAAIIVIVVASLFIVLVLVDVSCFAFNNAGVLFLLCGRRSKKDDIGIASEDKEPLRENGNAKVIVMDDRLKKDTKQTFDDRSATFKTTFIGKNSEV